MKTFVILLILAILFVVGSASALNYLTNRHRKRDRDRNDQQNSGQP